MQGRNKNVKDVTKNDKTTSKKRVTPVSHRGNGACYRFHRNITSSNTLAFHLMPSSNLNFLFLVF